LRHRIRRFKVSRNLAVGEDLVRLSGVRALVEGRLHSGDGQSAQRVLRRMG
jgi:hypothetical protein